MNEKERIYNKVKTIIRQDGQVSSYIGEDDFVSLVKGGISINFHLKQPSLDIENIFRTVKRTQKILHDRFSHHLEKIDIDISIPETSLSCTEPDRWERRLFCTILKQS